MDFAVQTLLEATVLTGAGLIFMGGIKGLAVAGVLASALLVAVKRQEFWPWEVLIAASIVLAGALLLWTEHRGRQENATAGLVGKFVSLVLFGTLLNPLAAFAVWFLVVGFGLVPRAQRKDVIWGFAPTILRGLYALFFLIGSNFLF